VSLEQLQPVLQIRWKLSRHSYSHPT
jgi:hypothetical protein